MAVTESKIEERLMRMGNEARYMKATDKALDMNELRKLAVKQLTKEDEQHKQEQAKTYQAWIDKIQSCPKLEHHYIMVFRNNIPTVEQYAGKLVLAAIKQYQFRHIYGNIPAFTA
jgi:hypothetical protein